MRGIAAAGRSARCSRRSNLTGGHARAVLALMDDIRRDDNSLKVQQNSPTQ